jgi:hypothetical protein
METGKIIVSKDIRPPAFTLPARTFSRATGADGPSPFGGADEMDIGKAPTAVGATTGVRADAKAESPDNVFMDEARSLMLSLRRFALTLLTMFRSPTRFRRTTARP